MSTNLDNDNKEKKNTDTKISTTLKIDNETLRSVTGNSSKEMDYVSKIFRFNDHSLLFLRVMHNNINDIKYRSGNIKKFI